MQTFKDRTAIFEAPHPGEEEENKDEEDKNDKAKGNESNLGQIDKETR